MCPERCREACTASLDGDRRCVPYYPVGGALVMRCTFEEYSAVITKDCVARVQACARSTSCTALATKVLLSGCNNIGGQSIAVGNGGDAKAVFRAIEE